MPSTSTSLPRWASIASSFPLSINSPSHLQCLSNLKANQQTHVPVYSFVQHQRLAETHYLYGPSIVIAEGIMTLHDPHLRSLYDLKVYELSLARCRLQ